MSQDTCQYYILFFRHLSPEALPIADSVAYFAIIPNFQYPEYIQITWPPYGNMGVIFVHDIPYLPEIIMFWGIPFNRFDCLYSKKLYFNSKTSNNFFFTPE